MSYAYYAALILTKINYFGLVFENIPNSWIVVVFASKYKPNWTVNKILNRKMNVDVNTILWTILWPTLITLFWIFFAFIPRFIRTSKADASVLRLFCIMTSIACWLFWACCYIFQFGPFFGPRLHSNTILILAREWNNKIIKF